MSNARKPGLDAYTQEHVERLKAAVLQGHTLATLADWIQRHTFLRGQPFTFLNHEFQLRIASDSSRGVNVRKCSQIGLSELSARLALATCSVLSGSTFIYTLPTAAFAKTFAKTRMDPIIATSPALSAAANSITNNSEVKQFNDSFLFIKGTVGQAAAISVPADGLFHDEVDFSDLAVLSNYESRLTHSPHKLKRKFSTPTVTGYGISAEMDASRRFWYMVKCNHCGEQFVPNYLAHVRIPGWDRAMKEITRDRLPHIAYQQAELHCPSCDAVPSLQPEHREWVLENNSENHEAAGYQIQPFDAPNIISIPDLVVASTKYERHVDFVNFALGLPAEDKESTLTKADIDACYVEGAQPGFFTNVMGIDMGLICHVVVAGVDPYGRLMVVHTERVPLAQLETRKQELGVRFQVRLTVMDSQPYADTLMRLQAKDSNLYGAVYVQSKDLAIYTVKKLEDQEEGDADERKVRAGEEQVRQVNINRNRAFDGLMEAIRSLNVLLVEDANRPIVTAHLQDMKRIRDFSSDKEVTFVWRKSTKGEDHFHHALGYAFVAAKMRAVAGSSIVLPGLVHSFKLEPPKK